MSAFEAGPIGPISPEGQVELDELTLQQVPESEDAKASPLKAPSATPTLSCSAVHEQLSS